jgi:hypothetical protein
MTPYGKGFNLGSHYSHKLSAKKEGEALASIGKQLLLILSDLGNIKKCQAENQEEQPQK